ncbi:peptidase inhibitor family I36 protein [Nonomuraea bangladeshensis]|uniref:peptidase inhibitor family I36 protein n=1 Tax=Nonomuraea bangladeshensis TaxID=404385 RepID=UPI0031E246E0
MISRIVRPLAAPALAALAIATSTATPAVAQTAADKLALCKPGMFCIFGDTGYRGLFFGSAANVPNVGTATAPFGFNINDHTSSFWNRTNRDICIYADTNFRNKMFWRVNNGTLVLGPVGAGRSTSNIGSDTNDKLSSFGPC